MTAISATTVLRSRHIQRPDKIVSTLLLRYPRFIHAEFMTHRVFSRNAASSRAIPVQRLIDDVVNDPVVPLHWGKNQKGMQAAQECDEAVERWNRRSDLETPFVDRTEAWLTARDNAVSAARALAAAGYHKQLVNRLLEPFVHITVLVSATEWDNFFELRDHKDAEPHIQMLAKEIRACIDTTANIQTLDVGEWHLPFVSAQDRIDASVLYKSPEAVNQALRYLSVARCASTSYKTVDGYDMTIERAVEIYHRLIGSTPIHASPAEHVCCADAVSYPSSWATPSQHGNFIGFRQLRHMIH